MLGTSSYDSLFEWLFETALNELYILHPQSLKFLAVNSAGRKRLGYGIEELLNMTPLDIAPEIDRQSFTGLLKQLLDGEQDQVRLKTVHRRKDGLVYPVEVLLQLFHNGRETVCLARVSDLTARKELEEKLVEKEEKCKLLLESIPSPVWLISRDRRILQQNKAAEAMFGTKAGDHCWDKVFGGGNLADEYKEALTKSGFPLPGTKCRFCLGDEAFEKNVPVSSEVELQDSVWDTWWIPVGKDAFLHTAWDVTKYKRMEEELRYLVVHDFLTKTYNRRYFSEKLAEETERVKRAGGVFSIIMLDIDRFKKINDTFGHSAGDQVLINLADAVQNRIRKIDTLARWGGEEFVILLPNTVAEQAVILAENLREIIPAVEMPAASRVTASFGVAGYRAGDTVDSLIIRADELMYQAKAAGGNSVCCGSEGERGPGG
jgi:diguanylate cyclase (GGDEF)-like protein/PAS domain S-box-containing protein